ncbi:hypothetical protein KSD_33280 [Ktedonobacter sp. SOSP1-85]|uniref:DUF4149 domain-containing protein n=1 Tax=Ktedonobacter robiniae TaxID=2778365 RepID=A0ABQ3UJE8_9CHLR|nr:MULTISPECIES: DUF6789 family protein [Ktedonobacter]GHO52856.1 hypothetical protein KSB_13310 [Ktedonobacter robiniae]GHO75557.1 hypothetical protein KSD_33280 [Ktedonobacter sp. SOSP1-85]
MKKVGKMLPGLLARDWKPGRAAFAGLIATLIYSIAMESDKFLIGNRFSDVRFLEGMLAGEKRSKRITALAWLLHLLNGVALAELYAAVVKRFLPGPAWLRGTIFGEAFVFAIWWITPLADKYHPLIRNGEMPHLFRWRSFWQNMLRHASYGLALGFLYPNSDKRGK